MAVPDEPQLRESLKGLFDVRQPEIVEDAVLVVDRTDMEQDRQVAFFRMGKHVLHQRIVHAHAGRELPDALGAQGLIVVEDHGKVGFRAAQQPAGVHVAEPPADRLRILLRRQACIPVGQLIGLILRRDQGQGHALLHADPVIHAAQVRRGKRPVPAATHAGVALLQCDVCVNVQFFQQQNDPFSLLFYTFIVRLLPVASHRYDSKTCSI